MSIVKRARTAVTRTFQVRFRSATIVQRLTLDEMAVAVLSVAMVVFVVVPVFPGVAEKEMLNKYRTNNTLKAS